MNLNFCLSEPIFCCCHSNVDSNRAERIYRIQIFDFPRKAELLSFNFYYSQKIPQMQRLKFQT